MNFAQKEISYEELMNFKIKETLVLWISGSKKSSFQKQEVSRKMIFPQYFLRKVGGGNASALLKKR